MGFLETDIKYLKGVGDKRAKTLEAEMEIRTFGDLLMTFPYRYVDTSRFYRISEFSGEMPSVQVLGRFIGFQTEGEGLRQRLKAIFSDGRSLMEVVWFSRIQFFQKAYKPGVDYILFGKPTYYKGWQMAHPEVSAYDAAKPPQGFKGIYSLPDKLRKRGFSVRFISDLAGNLLSHPRFREVEENLPPEITARYSLMPFREAVSNLHFPASPESLQKARERMKFEELFYLQLHILRYARELGRRIKGFLFPRIGECFNSYYREYLPFELTGAQKRVLREIRDDMRTGRQMNRLLQGDVGSGKTMVAFMTMLMAADNGFQSAMMAPTEILAGQHYESLREWGAKVGLRVELLTGSTRAAARREIHSGLMSGDIDILVGTHALIEDTVQFRNLGLTVIDEQHRFGVAQRARMWKKGETAPHVLVMTATPIPRTLAMTVYGDLDVSVIDELPPGRKPIETILKFDNNRVEVDRLILREIKAGRQVYIVYPLVRENPKLELKSVAEGFKRVEEKFPGIRACMVHGQLKAAEKDRQMELFVSGEARILVATTVIEVGVNVPNASVMVIENAERFGLSQLHQLRGRVGRGADKSYCILMTKHNIGGDTRKRLGIMTETTDGFLISEADMKMRGPGDMEGTQQSGIAFNLKMANLASDGQILTLARQAADALLNGHPELVESPAGGHEEVRGEIMKVSDTSLELIKKELRHRFAKTYDWSQIS